MVSVPLAHRWLRVIKPKQFLLGLSLHVFRTCSHFQKLFGSVKCECASRALAEQKGEFGTVHLIVYIFPLKDVALNLIFLPKSCKSQWQGRPALCWKDPAFSNESRAVTIYQFYVFNGDIWKSNVQVKKHKSLKWSGYSLLLKCFIA